MKKFLILAVFIAVIGAIICLGPDPDPGRDIIEKNIIHAQIDSINEVAESTINSAEIYIDASGSMKGYFISDECVFSGQLAKLKSYISNTQVYFVGQREPFRERMTTIISDLKKQPNKTATNFDELLTMLCKKSTPDKLCFLVSDGIMSIGKTTNKALEELGVIVKDSISKNGKDKAVAIFQYASEFISNSSANVYYWNHKNEGVNLKCNDRPYYVIAVGSKEAIRSLRNDAKRKLSPVQSLYFGIHDYAGHNKTTQAEKIEAHLEKPYEDVVLNATLPPCLLYYSNKYICDNMVVEMNGKEVSREAYNPEQKPDSVIQNGSLNIIIKQEKLPLNSDAEGLVEFTVKIKNVLPEEWTGGVTGLSSSDDTQIATASMQQKKTYGLETLLNGIKSALDPEDNLIEIKFKFNL